VNSQQKNLLELFLRRNVRICAIPNFCLKFFEQVEETKQQSSCDRGEIVMYFKGANTTLVTAKESSVPEDPSLCKKVSISSCLTRNSDAIPLSCWTASHT
jgi:hypothetical protein